MEVREDRFAVLQEMNDGTRRNAGRVNLLEIGMRFDRCVGKACVLKETQEHTN